MQGIVSVKGRAKVHHQQEVFPGELLKGRELERRESEIRKGETVDG